jgi:hypothetical protein
MSAYCLNAGAGERIVGSSRSSRFTGHTAITSLIFRRLLEDDSSLQSTMENEIRSTVLKMYSKKEKSVSSDKERIIVQRKPFIEKVTHLLCRDADSFVKALAVLVAFEKDAQSEEWWVRLLNLRNVRKI